MTKKMTNDEYAKRVFETVGDEYSVLEKYVDIKTKILMKHNICGHEWKISPNKFSMGRRCPKCSNERTHNLQRKSVELLSEQIHEIFNGKVILIGGEYINNSSVMDFYCFTCENEFSSASSNILFRKRCPICSKRQSHVNRIKSQEEFLNGLFEVYKNEYIPLTKYITSDKHVLMRHSICGNEWLVSPSNILQGYGCPKCAINKRANSQRKEINVFLKEVDEIGQGEYILIGEYVNRSTKIEFKHVPCGNIVFISPANFLKGRGCRFCASSNGEKRIRAFLEENSVEFTCEYVFDDCRYVSSLWFDFYLPRYNLCIEYQGKQHYESLDFFGGEKSFKEQVIKDRIKEKYCKENNIPLLIIPYWEFDNIKEILEQTLSELG